MKLIIAGSRHFNFGYQIIDVAISGIPELAAMIPYRIEYDSSKKITEIVSGAARGIDTVGEQWATAPFWELPNRTAPKVKRFPADWDGKGKAAGHIRNQEMAEYADALLLIWDGESRGSASMREKMLKLNKPVYEVVLRKV